MSESIVKCGLSWDAWYHASKNKFAVSHLKTPSIKNHWEGKKEEWEKRDAFSLCVEGVSKYSPNNEETIISGFKSLPNRFAKIVDFEKDPIRLYYNAAVKKLGWRGGTAKRKKEILVAVYNLFLNRCIDSIEEDHENQEFHCVVIKHPNSDYPKGFYRSLPLGVCNPRKYESSCHGSFIFKPQRTRKENISSLLVVLEEDPTPTPIPYIRITQVDQNTRSCGKKGALYLCLGIVVIGYLYLS